MRVRSKLVLPLVWVALAMLLVSCGPKDDVITLKLGHALDTGHVVHKGMMYMAERLEFYSHGTMRI
jgi:TRAP-type C4-dicarboxylate transport system substrate-binding protein